LSPQTVREAAKGPLPEPEPMSIGKFRWPVRGRVISQFGALPTGVRNDGINVAVPEGTSVKAAENGVVAYVGNELKGYGNLILIRHADDWVTAYAHNSQMLVKKGEQVRRGQIIAKAGQSGNVAQPQLHFELRKGSKPVDPVPYLDGTG
jgi:murein DD-endopeptidase MepM/ murein hydrolase activator NlpD